MTLNPLVSQADVWCHRIVLHNVLEPLIRRVGPDRFRAHLARMTVDPQGRHYVFRLRSNVRFHDGRLLTGADVKYTLDLLRGRRSPSSMFRIELADVVEVTDPNPLTVEVKLGRSNHLLPAVLAEIGILPAHLYKRLGPHSTQLNMHPVGTGPFVHREPGKGGLDKERIVLERSESYWGPRPALTEVVFRPIGQPARALAAVKNGEVDLLPDLYPGYYPDQVEHPRLGRRLRLFRLHPYRLRLLLFNLRRGPLKQLRVRLALAHLLDRQQHARAVRRDLAQLLSAPLWPPSGWYDRTLHPRPHSREEASRLLNGAGWILPGKGGKLRQRLGHPLSLKLLQARGGSDGELVSQLRADARAVGIDLRAELASFGFLRAQLERGRFDLAIFGLALRPGADLSPLLHSQGALNFGGYRNATVDGLLESLRAAADPVQRQRLGRQLHRALFDDPPMIVIHAPIELMVVNRRVEGIATDGQWPDLASLRLAERREEERAR